MHLARLIDQIERAAQTPRVILMGDFNLAIELKDDAAYSRHKMLNEFTAATAAAGLEYLPTSTTWHSYGRFLDGGGASTSTAATASAVTASTSTSTATATRVQRHSTLDHCYVAGVSAQVRLLPDATTDHSPVLLTVDPGRVSGSNSGTKTVKRRNFKAVRVAELEAALESTWDWGRVHQILGVNAAHQYVVDGIVAALDVVAPLAEIKVKKGDNIYLSTETLRVIKQGDLARARGDPDPAKYRNLRNEAMRLVRRDKLRSNISTLNKAAGDPRVLWQLANSELGKPRATLPQHLIRPDNSRTVDDKGAADLMATYYVKKVVDLRAEIANSPDAPTPAWPPEAGRGKTFSFSFARAGRVAKVSKGLKNTEALGVDGIPVSILKKGVALLSSPLAHLVNRSMATGVVPSGFKLARVCPVYKVPPNPEKTLHHTGQCQFCLR
jgi:hypothetical protein